MEASYLPLSPSNLHLPKVPTVRLYGSRASALNCNDARPYKVVWRRLLLLPYKSRNNLHSQVPTVRRLGGNIEYVLML